MKKLPLILTIIFLAAATGFAADFHAAVLGDRTGGANQDVFRGIITEINALHPDVVFCVGDLIEGPQPDGDAVNSQWDLVNGTLEMLEMPFIYVPGNNDIFDETSRQIYSLRTKTQPYYSTDIQDVHVIVLDNSQARNVEEMGESQLEWLKNDLAAHSGASLTFVFFHKPFWYDAFETGSPFQLHELFRQHGVDWVFSGHYHRYVTTEKDGIQYVMVGSSGGHVGNNPDRGEFYHFGWMRVDGDNVDFSVIKSGAVLDREFLTLEKAAIQNRIEEEHISFDGIALNSRGVPEGTATVKIGSVWDVPFGGGGRWTLPSGWTVSPQNVSYTLTPGTPTELPFSCVFTGTEIYPLPELILEYPWNDVSLYTVQRRLPVTRRLEVPRVEKAPELDGRREDACWESAVEIRGFGDGSGAPARTEALTAGAVAAGDDLYFHIHAVESKPGEMLQPATERDGPVFRGDCIYIMLWSQGEPVQVTQLILSPKGIINDGKGVLEAGSDGRPQMDRGWNAGMDVAAAESEDGWMLEVRIPLADTAGTADRNRLGFNMMRIQSRLNEFATWQEPATFDPGDPAELILR